MVFIESRWFTRRLQELARGAADDVLREIQKDLLNNPERGRLVPGLGGIRKARTANPSRRKGKRSGYRYFYLFLEYRGHFHLLVLLDKDEQADLTASERAVLRDLAQSVRHSAR